MPIRPIVFKTLSIICLVMSLLGLSLWFDQTYRTNADELWTNSAQTAPTPGLYKFSATQRRNSSQPVAYDPCRTIRVVIVNSDRAPKGGNQLVEEAMTQVANATGLKFVLGGRSTESIDTTDRNPEVVVTWTSASERSDLQGGVAALGGSRILRGLSGRPDVYVSGRVAIDTPQIAELLKSSTAVPRSVIMHEFGHVVGLAHVNDPTQLMNPKGSDTVVDFQGGDRQGLSLLGKGACVF